MILVTENFRHVNGQPARNRSIDVFFRDTTTRANLFDDEFGSVPLTNPIETDEIGNLDFYIEEGSYDFVALGARIPFDAEPHGTGGGGGSERFAYTQPVGDPAATWIVNHNLGMPTEPVVLLDSDPDRPVWTDVEHGTPNQTTIIFPSPVSGKAFF